MNDVVDITSPHISPVARKLAKGRCVWAQLWSEKHSRSYGWSEEQVRARLNQPGPGQAMVLTQSAFSLTNRNSPFCLFYSNIYLVAIAELVKYAG